MNGLEERFVKIGLLLDYYESVISKKQFDALDMYYNKDMSLSEIGESLGKTRQGVFEILKRGEEKILDLEEKLKCHEMSLRCEELKEALCLIVSLQNSNKYDEATAIAKNILDKTAKETDN